MSKTKTKVIDRTSTVHDKTYDLGVDVEIMVSRDTCGTTRILGEYITIPPGSRNRARYHTNCELGWYLVKGSVLHVLGTKDMPDYSETECSKGAFGYVARGDTHAEINLSDTEPAELLCAFVGANSVEGVGTVFVDPPEVVTRHLEQTAKQRQ